MRTATFTLDGTSIDLLPLVSGDSFERLPQEVQDELTEVLDQHMQKLEAGEEADTDDLLRRHPELEGPIRELLAGMEFMKDAAVGFAADACSFWSDDAPCAGRQLGNFQIVREIGRGGMGVVYEAREMSLNRRVALKVLPAAALLDQRQIARFRNEANAAAQLNHPNIVPVFSIGMDQGVHFYAMQFIEGRPLDNLVDELKSSSSTELTPSRPAVGSVRDDGYIEFVAELGIWIARALQEAHESGIVHRDIKPSNLLLDEQGDVWITDFGLARFQADHDLTRTGDIVGTLCYMSPEQTGGRPELVDYRVDIYSLGATLYELLTTEVIVDGFDIAQILRQIQNEPPKRIRSLNPAVPADLETIVLKSVEKSREDRYATASELADDLQRFLDGQPIQARAPGVADRAAKWMRRNHGMLVGSLCVSIVLLLVMTVATAMISQQKNQVDDALEDARTNLARAEVQYENARTAVDELGADVAEQLASIPETARLRHYLLQETVDRYQQFIEQDLELIKSSGDDVSLHGRLAMTWTKAATTYDQLGEPQKALDAQRKAREIYRRISREAAPASRNMYRARWAICENAIGLLLGRLGETHAAVKSCRQARELQQSLVADAPGEIDYRRQLALTSNNLGELLNKLRETQEARRWFETAIDQQRALFRENPSDLVGCDLAVSLNNLASMLTATDTSAAQSHFRAAIAIYASLAHSPTAPHAHCRQRALIHNNLGSLLNRRGDAGDAVNEYLKSVGLLQRLISIEPNHRVWRRDLAVTHNNLGMAQTALSSYDQAAASFDAALGIQEQLLRESDQELADLSYLGGIWNNLGIVHQHRNDLAAAAESFEKAIAWQQKAHLRAPQSARYRQYLGMHYANYSRVLRQLGRTADAEEVALLQRGLKSESHLANQ